MSHGMVTAVSPYSHLKAIERERRIQKETRVQKNSFSASHLLSFPSRFRTLGSVRRMHLLRRYSALAVVFASALFVSIHNIEMRRTENGLLPFFKNDSEEEHTKPNAFRMAAEQSTELASLPYVKSTAININTKEERMTEMLPVQSNDPGSPLRVQSLIATANAMEKDPDEGDGVKIYTVKDGDTLSTIAQKNNITVNTILWANTVDDEDSIKPGDEIFILPVAGLKHIVKSGETLKQIAEEYKADEERIIAFNSLPANGNVESGMEIVIPGGEKELPKQETSPTPLIEKRTYIATNDLGGGSKTTVAKSHGMSNTFPYGYCTWFVAQKRYVPWRGNAGAWLYNAKAMGYKTGKSPQAGSIVVTTDNTYYGHVALVTKVSDGTITISEMNYKGWGKTSTRTVSTSDRKIRGYIY